jgi:hypothetical protein
MKPFNPFQSSAQKLVQISGDPLAAMAVAGVLKQRCGWNVVVVDSRQMIGSEKTFVLDWCGEDAFFCHINFEPRIQPDLPLLAVIQEDDDLRAESCVQWKGKIELGREQTLRLKEEPQLHVIRGLEWRWKRDLKRAGFSMPTPRASVKPLAKGWKPWIQTIEQK